jgi:hypothetical protein
MCQGNGLGRSKTNESALLSSLFPSASGSLNLPEPLNYGRFWVNGNQIDIRREAVKFVNNSAFAGRIPTMASCVKE